MNNKIKFTTKNDIKIWYAYQRIKRYYYAITNQFPPKDKEFKWFQKRYGDDVLKYGWDYVRGATFTTWRGKMGYSNDEWNSFIRIKGEPKI